MYIHDDDDDDDCDDDDDDADDDDKFGNCNFVFHPIFAT